MLCKLYKNTNACNRKTRENSVEQNVRQDINFLANLQSVLSCSPVVTTSEPDFAEEVVNELNFVARMTI